MIDNNKILILAPHTDDGELGCGASIAKFCSEGRQVYYAAFSTCKKSLPAGLSGDTLEKECKQAIATLGISEKNLMLFDFEVREFPANRQEILERLIFLQREWEPDLVMIPDATDIHQDHQVIHQEALRAFKKTSILGYELPWNQQSFMANYFIRVSKENLDKKIKAIQAYESQSHRNYTQADFLQSLARVRGVQCQAEFAEAFTVYRLID